MQCTLQQLGRSRYSLHLKWDAAVWTIFRCEPCNLANCTAEFSQNLPRKTVGPGDEHTEVVFLTEN